MEEELQRVKDSWGFTQDLEAELTAAREAHVKECAELRERVKCLQLEIDSTGDDLRNKLSEAGEEMSIMESSHKAECSAWEERHTEALEGYRKKVDELEELLANHASMQGIVQELRAEMEEKNTSLLLSEKRIHELTANQVSLEGIVRELRAEIEAKDAALLLSEDRMQQMQASHEEAQTALEQQHKRAFTASKSECVALVQAHAGLEDALHGQRSEAQEVAAAYCEAQQQLADMAQAASQKQEEAEELRRLSAAHDFFHMTVKVPCIAMPCMSDVVQQ